VSLRSGSGNINNPTPGTPFASIYDSTTSLKTKEDLIMQNELRGNKPKPEKKKPPKDTKKPAPKPS